MNPSDAAAPDTKSRASWWHLATSRGVPRRSLYVALIVGSVLTLINQYDAIPSLGDKPFSFLKALLSYCVPYCVATYGAATARRAFGE